MKDPKPNWDTENQFIPRDPAFRQAFGEQISGSEHLDMAGMTKHEEDEFLLHYGPRKERKALKKRLKQLKRAEKDKKRWRDDSR